MCIEALRTTDLCEARGHTMQFQFNQDDTHLMGGLFSNRSLGVTYDVYKCTRCGATERRPTK